jgi:hypothetical protein
MSIVSAICNQYKGDIIGVTAANQNISTDVYKMALYTTSRATLDKTTTVYDTTNEVVGTGYAAGGFTLSAPTITQVGDNQVLSFTTDPNWPTSTLALVGGALIYNSTKNRAIATLNTGTLNTTSGTLTIDLGNSVVTGTTLAAATTTTLTDSGNGFITAGFQVGQTIVTTIGTNTGLYTITAVAAGTLTCSGATFATQTAGASYTVRAATILI